jgi:hypothetical protein
MTRGVGLGCRWVSLWLLVGLHQLGYVREVREGENWAAPKQVRGEVFFSLFF